jgi:hypothetical protein
MANYSEEQLKRKAWIEKTGSLAGYPREEQNETNNH